MGIYLRRSVTVGPLRFNLSTSGIGVSAGVKGFRVGTGPRGNYVQIGRSAIRYRASLPIGPSQPTSPTVESHFRTTRESHETLQEVESGDVLAMVDSTATDLLSELNAKRHLSRRSPLVLVLVLTVLAFFVGVGLGLPFWLTSIIIVAGGILTWVASRSDEIRKSVVLFYELSPELEGPYEQLMDAVKAMAACGKAWHIEAQGRISDWKHHAGASSLVKRQPTRIRFDSPSYIRTNIATASIWAGRQVLYFFPDRILVFSPNGVGAVGYRELNLTLYPQRFIEDGSVPADAQVVGQTWQYVNKKGGPDRRFKNNRQLPVCLYEELHFTSASGLNEIIQISRQGPGQGIANSLQTLATALPR